MPIPADPVADFSFGQFKTCLNCPVLPGDIDKRLKRHGGWRIHRVVGSLTVAEAAPNQQGMAAGDGLARAGKDAEGPIVEPRPFRPLSTTESLPGTGWQVGGKFIGAPLSPAVP